MRYLNYPFNIRPLSSGRGGGEGFSLSFQLNGVAKPHFAERIGLTNACIQMEIRPTVTVNPPNKSTNIEKREKK